MARRKLQNAAALGVMALVLLMFHPQQSSVLRSVQALNLRPASLRKKAVSFLPPRKYRVLDQEEQVGRVRFRLKRFRSHRRRQEERLQEEKNKLIHQQGQREELQEEKNKLKHQQGHQEESVSVVVDKETSRKTSLRASIATRKPSFVTKSTKLTTTQSKTRSIQTLEDLHTAILDEGLPLRQTQLDLKQPPEEDARAQVASLLTHPVLQLLSERFHSQSTPGHRLDNATLALSMEGGGMRGSVSAGMASAIACLGLCNAFDGIYGSSAGSVVGAYMVSRQMCVDVYTELLPAAQRKFVCKKRILAALAASAFDLVLPSSNLKESASPGMNISFVLHGIMGQDEGLRPLDLKSFWRNNEHQPLRVATSKVTANGTLVAQCLGTDDFDKAAGTTTQSEEGLFTCLQAGMTVPGATGAPVHLRHSGCLAFDAFCFEPLPYRSAVAEGASHVLVLRSRPESFEPKTQPGVYEQAVAPLYFRSRGHESAAKFFEQGGQQYIYLEDILTLQEGKRAGLQNSPFYNKDGVPVPPRDILYGVPLDERAQELAQNRQDWKKAHLFPIVVGKDVPELPTLEQGKDAVVEAVRGGFAAAFDILAPAIGWNMTDLTGSRVAELVFPMRDDVPLEQILQQQVNIRGEVVVPTANNSAAEQQSRLRRLLRRLLRSSRRRRQDESESENIVELLGQVTELSSPTSSERCHRQDARTLLKHLPGLQNGNLPPLASGLHHVKEQAKLL